jgi:hypothetical protein
VTPAGRLQPPRGERAAGQRVGVTAAGPARRHAVAQAGLRASPVAPPSSSPRPSDFPHYATVAKGRARGRPPGRSCVRRPFHKVRMGVSAAPPECRLHAPSPDGVGGL